MVVILIRKKIVKIIRVVELFWVNFYKYMMVMDGNLMRVRWNKMFLRIVS